MSHTKLDKDFCNRFDIAVARVGIRAFRSEFETIRPPAWDTIKKQIEASTAVFLLVGKELIKAQAMSDVSKEARDEWKHTQNWIAYEVGLACMKGIDVWVVCDMVDINFPVPYLNNYCLGLHGSTDASAPNGIGFMRWVLEMYNEGKTFPLGIFGRMTNCAHNECKAQFNLHTTLNRGQALICPTCLRKSWYLEGWLLEKKTQ